ncbi:protein TPX2 [Andrographis paniculata]|uniref:protein TPX2 n=1 Tax=Andrographis paniculata TaxID=175694 RepID=UPI0021E7B6CC|nr:protein TPX2 [Andrographis paniculata]
MEEQMAVEDTAAKEEVEVEDCSFTVYEIDFDYEFDAPRFFDFSQEELPLGARQAEAWFNSARSYPPSPFVCKLVPKEVILKENIQVSPKSKGREEISAESMDDEDGHNRQISTTQHDNRIMFKNPTEQSTSGLTFHSHTENRPDSKAQFSKKPSFPRSSSLMMPTASHLAKQNHPFRSGHSRSIFEKTSNNSISMNGVENQAAKRQKLEGGLLRKVEGASQLQQNNFVHKLPKREGLVDGNTAHTRPRFTIPREPDLETAHRAQRIRFRPKSSKEAEKVTSAVGGFKALPLNKKVFEAPSWIPKRSTPCLPKFQEFHLKTSERALQHSSTISNSNAPCNQSDKVLHKHANSLLSEFGNRECSRTNTLITSRPDDGESSHCFKALALNKKILESKGDVGVFRNNKKEATVPMEFDFHTGKRSQYNPPVELFSKLSVTSDAQRTANFESKLQPSINRMLKGTKENRWDCSQQGNEIKQTSSKLPLPSGMQQLNAAEGSNGVHIAAGNNWSKNIR